MIHPSAQIDPGAVLGANVQVGAFAVIGAGVEIGDDTRIGPHCVLTGPTRIGRGNVIHAHATVGNDPQDKKFRGERTELVIGDRNTIREFSTFNIGSPGGGGVTRVGHDNWLMAYVHLAHDCIVGNHTIFANNTQLAGHVEVGDWAILGGMTPVHQFTRIGAHAFVGGCSRVQKDVPPYVKAAGNPAALFGLNVVGLDRRGFPEAVKAELKRAYRLFFNSKLNITQALARARSELHPYPEVERFLAFIEESERGVTV